MISKKVLSAWITEWAKQQGITTNILNECMNDDGEHLLDLASFISAKAYKQGKKEGHECGFGGCKEYAQKCVKHTQEEISMRLWHNTNEVREETARQIFEDEYNAVLKILEDENIIDPMVRLVRILEALEKNRSKYGVHLKRTKG